jgi:hypothetical protein
MRFAPVADAALSQANVSKAIVARRTKAASAPAASGSSWCVTESWATFGAAVARRAHPRCLRARATPRQLAVLGALQRAAAPIGPLHALASLRYDLCSWPLLSSRQAAHTPRHARADTAAARCRAGMARTAPRHAPLAPRALCRPKLPLAPRTCTRRATLPASRAAPALRSAARSAGGACQPDPRLAARACARRARSSCRVAAAPPALRAWRLTPPRLACAVPGPVLRQHPVAPDWRGASAAPLRAAQRIFRPRLRYSAIFASCIS